MGFMEDLRRSLDLLQGKQPKRNPGPTAPTAEERLQMLEAGLMRKPPPHQYEMMRYMWERSPIRMLRMQRDFNWMKKQMKKIGQNPEDARWLLK